MARKKKSDLHIRFGRLLGAHRRIAGLTQEALAEAAGLGVDTISKLEVGLTGASFETIERLSQALRIDPAELFTHELGGKPFDRKAFTDFVAEVARLSYGDLLWIGEVVRSALKSRRTS